MINQIHCQILRLSVLFFLSISSAMAGVVPVSLSGPVPAIASSYTPESTETITYTITNNVPKNIPIEISGISSPLARTTVNNDCGNTLPPGPSTCHIGIVISPSSQIANTTINQTLLIDYQSRRPLTSNINFSVSAPSPLPSIFTFVAAGQDSITSLPLLTVSTDNANVFTNITPSGTPSSSYYNSAACTGYGSSTVCVAGGHSTSVPLLSVSTDNGNTWNNKNITGASSNVDFYGVSCTGSGSSAICVAAGGNNSTTAPVIALSTDGGNTWATKTISGAPAHAALNTASCTGSGSTAVCIAGGQIIGGSNLPLLIVSTDGGNTWAVKSVAGFTTSGQVKASSCVGSGSSATCIGAGTTTTNIPIIVVSTDGGNTWNTKSISGVTSGLLQSASCTSTNGIPLCTAAGAYSSAPFAPLVVQSIDGGNTWAAVSIAGSTNGGTIKAISCANSGANAVCTAVGRDNITSDFFIASTTNGGSSWSTRPISSSPVIGIFQGVSCSGTTLPVTCIAAGNTGTTQPIIAVSSDSSNTWNFASIAGQTASGSYRATGANHH